MSGSGPETGNGPPNLKAVPGGAEGEPRPTVPHAGSHSQLAALFKAHNEALLRFLTCRLRSAQEAKEVAQEAYVRLLQLDTPDSVGYLRAYLFKTAANLAADRLKSAARHERIDKLEFFDETEEFEPSPEGGIAAQQELAAILKLLDELPARCRYAFLMHRFYGHGIAEVAGLMDLTPRMVQLYVERALVFCRDRLKDSSGGRS
jgi:RNA polymerase sigma-70 factor (ECF subfamily)